MNHAKLNVPDDAGFLAVASGRIDRIVTGIANRYREVSAAIRNLAIRNFVGAAYAGDCPFTAALLCTQKTYISGGEKL